MYFALRYPPDQRGLHRQATSITALPNHHHLISLLYLPAPSIIFADNHYTQFTYFNITIY